MILICVIAIMLVTGVTAYGLNSANDDSGDSGFFHQGDHQKNHKKVNHSKDKKSNSKSSNKDKSSDNAKTEINLDLTMQQNVNNFLFNIPTAFILDVDDYDEGSCTYDYVYLPDGDEYDWEVDLKVIEFDEANGRNLTQEDVESYASGDYSETTINGITGYYSQDGDWETFVFGSGNEVFILDVYGISLEVVLNDFVQEPLVGDMEAEEDTSDEEDLTEEEDLDDTTEDDSSYDDYDDSSYDDSGYDDSSYDDSGYDDYDDSYYDDSGYDDYDDSYYDEDEY